MLLAYDNISEKNSKQIQLPVRCMTKKDWWKHYASQSLQS